MSATVQALQPLAAPLLAYAEKKLERLERHGNPHDVRLILDHDENRIPSCSAEIIVHINHTRLAIKTDGATIQEAVDRAVDKADRQVVRQKERAGEHRARDNGHSGGDRDGRVVPGSSSA